MSDVTLPIADVDEAVANAKPGETVEVYATLKIKSKTDSEIVAEVSNVEKCEDMEGEDSEDSSEGPDHESESGDPEEDKAEGEYHKSEPMKGKGKGMGILIMVGGPKKK